MVLVSESNFAVLLPPVWNPIYAALEDLIRSVPMFSSFVDKLCSVMQCVFSVCCSTVSSSTLGTNPPSEVTIQRCISDQLSTGVSAVTVDTLRLPYFSCKYRIAVIEL